MEKEVVDATTMVGIVEITVEQDTAITHREAGTLPRLARRTTERIVMDADTRWTVMDEDVLAMEADTKIPGAIVNGRNRITLWTVGVETPLAGDPHHSDNLHNMVARDNGAGTVNTMMTVGMKALQAPL